jgi:hypothetical protein
MVASYAADVAWRQIQEEKRSNCTGSDLIGDELFNLRGAQPGKQQCVCCQAKVENTSE